MLDAEPEQRASVEALSAFLPAPAVVADPGTGEEAAGAFTLSGMSSARVVALEVGAVRVALACAPRPVEASIAEDVDLEIVEEAFAQGERVLVEPGPGGSVVIVGALRTRRPEVLRLKAEQIEIEAERELVLRSGVAAVRLREDGDVEVVGSRISAASRGLFRLVGRMLRLN